MEPNIFRYIWTHTRREQIFIVIIVMLSMVPYYLAFDLPKQIVNGPIQGQGFESAGAKVAFLEIGYDLPFIGHVQLSDGLELERMPLLMALSLTFLALVIVNGLFKFYINTYKGRLGERLLRRIRYELVDRILRFPPARFKQLKSGEVSSMVKDEIEPLGGFAADAFTQPAMLGGQALTALVFIFIQHFWLGAVACFMAMIQVAIIPRMRRRLIFLGRERQLTARELAGRVSEIVDGIQTIHAYDTTNYERADIVARLGRIFRIRYDIYQWKFLVKFINNFLAQLTPFLFYSIGGYLTIRGTLDVGQLVAVINAYKELPGPLKELIDWDLARQDIQVKYEQVVDQFEAEGMIDPARHAIDTPTAALVAVPLALQNVTVAEEQGPAQVEDLTLEFAPGETVALIGGSTDGPPVLGELLGGAVRPTHGRIVLGEQDLSQMPEGLTGRLISYAGPTGYYFSGSLRDNIVYGLNRRPAPDTGAPDLERYGREWQRREAQRAGNPAYSTADDWIDHAAVQPHPGPDGLLPSLCRVLEVVGLDGDIIALALRGTIDPASYPGMAERMLEFRHALRQTLEDRGLRHLVLPFEPDRYNAEATIGENLFFGVPADPDTSIRTVLRHPYFAGQLEQSGLAETLFDLGWNFAQATIEIFQGLEDHPEMLQWLTYMKAEELPEYEQLVQRTEVGGFAVAAPKDRRWLIRLAFAYVEPRYRFGLLDDKLRKRLVELRQAIRNMMPEELKSQVVPYDPFRFLPSASLIENILFGKINQRVGNADEQVRAIGRELLRERIELRQQVIAAGLAQQIGPGGRRLSLLQRQRLGLARMLIRRSNFYVLNEPLAGADLALQEKIIASVLAYLAEQPDPPGVVWVLANPALAHHFSRTLEFSKGHLLNSTLRHEDRIDALPIRHAVS